MSPVLPLVAGERMGRAEFEARFDATPDLKRAELIEGVVHLEWRRQFRFGAAGSALVACLGMYHASTPGTWANAHGHIRLDDFNMVQPQAALLIRPSSGGQCRVSEDDYLEGGPELVGEVDTHLDAKREVYRRHGVREYLAWQVDEKRFHWFVRRHGYFERRPPDGDGVIRSETFQGLWVDVRALLDDDGPRIVEAVNRGIASPEHAAFVRRLADARASQLAPPAPSE